MIQDLLELKVINKWRLLLTFYKKIGLQENQLIIIMLVMNFSNKNKKIISSSILNEYCNFEVHVIDEILDSLIQDGYAEIHKNNNNPLTMDFKLLFKKIDLYLKGDKTSYDSIFNYINNMIDAPLNNKEKSILLSIVGKKFNKKEFEMLFLDLDENISKSKFLEIIKDKYSNNFSSLTKVDWLK